MRETDSRPFLRGIAFEPQQGIPYPRLPATDLRIPQDIALWSWMPVGVRLELKGDAEELEIEYVLQGDDLGGWGDGAGVTFEVHRGGRVVDVQRVEPRSDHGVLRLLDDEVDPDVPAVVYLPTGYRPELGRLRAHGGDVEVAPARPRWVAYGDSITAGFGSSAPSAAWASVVSRRHDLDVVNLGFPAAGRGELAVAEHVPELAPEVISVAFGTNCWSTLAHPAPLLAAQTSAFIDAVAPPGSGTPVVVISPIVRPDAEQTSNSRGATLEELRRAVEDSAAALSSAVRPVTVVQGRALVDAGDLADGVHPNDHGHAAMAAAIGPLLRRIVDVSSVSTNDDRHGEAR